MVDQIHRHAVRIGSAQHRETFEVGAEAHRNVAQDRRGLDIFNNRGVSRDDQRRIGAGALQGAGQRSDHVGEAAGLCVGRGFGRNDGYLHHWVQGSPLPKEA